MSLVSMGLMKALFVLMILLSRLFSAFSLPVVVRQLFLVVL